MNLPESIQDRLRSEAAKGRPFEACGFITRTGATLEVKTLINQAEKPEQHWLITAGQQMKARRSCDEIVAVWHSHPDRPAIFTDEDQASIEASRIPHVVVAAITGDIAYQEPNGFVLPLEGRQFIHGFLDCFSAVRDYYKTKLGIEIEDQERDHEWWNKGQDLYTEGYAKAGFKIISNKAKDAKLHDAIAIRLHSEVWNHTAIYRGACKIFHHRHGCISKTEHYGQFWQHRTLHILRHESQC